MKIDEKNEQPYSVFSRFQKICMIAIVINAILITGLSVYFYYPALNRIEEDLNTSMENVNLTITVYMIFQGISPSFWGPIADRLGRRPIYLLTITIFMASCVGLASAPNYATLLTMRMLQAFGSSSALATVAGTISDISTPSERGTYFGAMGAAVQVSPVIGPVLGGVIAQHLSWRWLFWILLFFAAWNGNYYANPTPFQWWRYHYCHHRHEPSPDGELSSQQQQTACQKPRSIKPFQALIFLLEPDVATGLVFRGLHYGVMHGYMTVTANFFGEWYGLGPTEVGLCYIPLGVGTIFGALVQGRLLDWDFKLVSRAYYGRETSATTKSIVDDHPDRSAILSTSMKAHYVPVDFPIYKARLRTSFLQSATMQMVTLIYGWGLKWKWPLAAMLALQCIVGFTATGIVNVYQTLLVDLFPNDSSSITATNNLVRCLLGALAISVIEPGIRTLGAGWMFTTLGLVLIISNVLPAILLKVGPQWRKSRADRENATALPEDSS